MSEKNDFVGKLGAFMLCLIATFFIAFMSSGLIALATTKDHVVTPVVALCVLIATVLLFWKINIYKVISKVMLKQT